MIYFLYLYSFTLSHFLQTLYSVFFAAAAVILLREWLATVVSGLIA